MKMPIKSQSTVWQGELLCRYSSFYPNTALSYSKLKLSESQCWPLVLASVLFFGLGSVLVSVEAALMWWREVCGAKKKKKKKKTVRYWQAECNCVSRSPLDSQWLHPPQSIREIKKDYFFLKPLGLNSWAGFSWIKWLLRLYLMKFKPQQNNLCYGVTC